MADQLRYDNQVVVVTGAGNGLGKQYAKFFAARGAKVVVNDLGGTFNGKGKNGDARVADIVVKEIKDAGGIAVANFDNVQNGDRIIETAIKNFGRVDVLINNAGILRDTTLRNMSQGDWDDIIDVHVHGAMKTTRAAWAYFLKQKYGRLINTTSASGLFGNFGQSNYAAAKVALVGLTVALAKEGASQNITCNTIAPAAGSRLTQTVWPPEMMDAFSPDFVVPLVGALVHRSCTETGGIYEAGAGHFSKIRWERSLGFVANASDKLTADLVMKNHARIVDFKKAEHPAAARDVARLSVQGAILSDALGAEHKGRVALVVGVTAPLGKVSALQFGRLGAKVVIYDSQNAMSVANEIKAAGGDAVALDQSMADGAAIIKGVLDAFGRIDIIVNNPELVRNGSFENMTNDAWYSVFDAHSRLVWQVIKAAWPFMLKQKYGRVVHTTTTSAIYGESGKANMAAAKAGTIGFTKTIAREGLKYDIVLNTIAPVEDSHVPEAVLPLVIALCSRKPPAAGRLYEAGNGWFASLRWQRARGVDFEHSKGPPSVEDVAKALGEIGNFNNPLSDSPDLASDGSNFTMGNVMKNPKMMIAQENVENRRYIGRLQDVVKLQGKPVTYTYTERDVILYNLAIGAKPTELSLVYEGSDNFQVLPTFGIVPTYTAESPYNLKDIVPNFDARMLLHSEQYMEIKQFPIPTSGTLTSTKRLIEAVDKGKAALIRACTTTTDSAGKPVFYNEGVTYIRGSGGWGGLKTPTDRGAATATNDPPSRAADTVVEEKTSDGMAAIFRLMGDRNPLHIDPEYSKAGGFDVPILHGLATFGVTGRHIYQTYGPFKSMKVRFSGTVLPGQTIVTEMWKVGSKVVFTAKVKETGKSCISNAAVELLGLQSNL